MAEFPAMMLWTDAYLGDTTHLTTIEHGAYLLLLIAMWRTKTKSLPNDPHLLARYARLTTGQWQRIWPRLEPFFQVDGNSIAQGRLTREAEAVRRRSAIASDNVNARWRKNKETADTDAIPKPYENDAIHNHNQNHKEKTKKKAGSRDPGFSEFYAIYPLKKGPDGAEKAYLSALRRGASHEQIMASAKAYAEEKRGTEPKFIAHPATWLNQGRWADETALPLEQQQDDGLTPHDRRMLSRLKYWRDTGKWSQEWGAEPGKPGSSVPQWLMERAA